MELVERVDKVVTAISGKARCGSEIKVDYKIEGETKSNDDGVRQEMKKDPIPTGESIALRYTNRDWRSESKWRAFGSGLLTLAPYVTMIWLAYITKATLIAMKGAAQ